MVVVERTNVRELTPEMIGGPVDLVVADLSFISLATVLPALTACASPDADIVPMVKPQFEVGKDRVGAGGVVSEPELRAESVLSVAAKAAGLGWETVGATASRCQARRATSSTSCGYAPARTADCAATISSRRCGAPSRKDRNDV